MKTASPAANGFVVYPPDGFVIEITNVLTPTLDSTDWILIPFEFCVANNPTFPTDIPDGDCTTSTELIEEPTNYRFKELPSKTLPVSVSTTTKVGELK